jgi:hypothetical protein
MPQVPRISSAVDPRKEFFNRFLQNISTGGVGAIGQMTSRHELLDKSL